MSEREVWYRYEQRDLAAPFDETGRMPGRTTVELLTFEVVRRTPKGAWIARLFRTSNEFGGGGGFRGAERFVLASARRRYACPSRDEAMASFVARKRRQIAVYEARIARARVALMLAVEEAR